MRVANVFTDPTNGETYPWPINHLTEENAGRSRAITRGAPTGTNVGLNRTQGDPSPVLLTLKGTMLTKAQRDETIRWWGKCDTHTIYFKDFEGAEYEVLITNFVPTRRAVARNQKDLANMPTWVIDYTIEMEVVRVISGPWAGVAA